MEWIAVLVLVAGIGLVFSTVWQALVAARLREELELVRGQADHFASECDGLRDRIDRAENAAITIAASLVLEAGSRFADEREMLRYDRDMLRDELERVRVAKALTPSDFVLLRDVAREIEDSTEGEREDELADDVRALAERLEKL